MAIFLSEDDEINFAVRKLYHDVVRRECTPQEQEYLRNVWKTKGADTALAELMDGNGAPVMAAERKALGLPPGPPP